jgi:hypothetical protein
MSDQESIYLKTSARTLFSKKLALISSERECFRNLGLNFINLKVQKHVDIWPLYTDN